jgi:predicted DsbA family dithiol-disulfide isomerase
VSASESSTAAPAADDPRITVEVWSDVVCPWCYLAKRRLEHAISAFERPAVVEVRYRSFELDPGAPVGGNVSIHEHLGRRYGDGLALGRAMTERVAKAAASEGLMLNFDIAVRANSFDAHRLVHMGLSQGGPALQSAVKERMFAAHFEEGKAIDDRSTLQRLGAEAGLDEHLLAAVLASDEHAEGVRADEAEARELGIVSVPFAVAGRMVALSGAQPVEIFVQMLHQAWKGAGQPT